MISYSGGLTKKAPERMRIGLILIPRVNTCFNRVGEYNRSMNNLILKKALILLQGDKRLFYTKNRGGWREMGIEPIKGFFESDSGERIIGHVLAYKSKSDFLEKAQKYISESRDEYTPVSDNVRMEHYILTSYDDTLYRQDVAEERNIQGEELLFYETDTLYDFEYYTFSEKEQDRIDDVLKELNIIYLHNGKNFPFDKWAIPVISYIEDLDEYQKAEVRKIFTQKRERGEWS